MKTKKFFALLLIGVLLLSFTSVPAFADDAGEYNHLFLTQLSFLPASLSEYQADKGITRGEFAYIMAKSLSLENIAADNARTISYEDVKSGDDFYKEIMLCTNFGLLSGDGTGLFRPTRKITAAQAVKVLMSALGYDEMAVYSGGYPSGYMVCAAQSGILKGVALSGDDALTANKAFVLLANALNTPVLSGKIVGSETITYDNIGGETILSTYHHIYKYSGKLRGTDEGTFLDIKPLKSDEILIDRGIYKTDLALSEFLGLQIDFYFDENISKVVAAIPASKGVKSLVVAAGDIVSYSNNTLYYAEGVDTEEASLSRGAEVMYNGRAVTNLQNSHFLIKSGEISLKDFEGDGIYDSVIISSAESFMVKKTDTYNGIFYDMHTPSKYFSEDETEILSFKDKFGNNMQVSELNPYDVVSVFKSLDGKYANLHYSNSETEGKLAEREEVGDDIYFVIAGKSYGVSENFKASAKTTPLGTEGIYVLDIYGNIAGIKPYGSSYKWGWYIASQKESELGGEVKVRLLTEEGTVQILNMSEYVMLDGKAVKAGEAHAALSAAVNGQLIRYYLQNSCLKGVDTTARGTNEPDDTLYPLYNGYDDSRVEITALMFNRYQQIFGSKVALDPLAKVFRVPLTTSSNDDEYKALEISHFIHDTNYYIDTYRTGSSAHSAEAVVMYKDGSVKDEILTTTEVTLVDKVTRTMTEDGELRYVIHGLCEGAKVSRIVKNDALIDELKMIVSGKESERHNLACGDVVRLATDNVTGYVTNMSLYYDRVNEVIKKNITVGTSITESNRMMKANVYSEDNGNLWITQNPLSAAGIELSVSDIESVNAASFKIYRCGKNIKGEYEVAISSVSEISDYRTNPNLFSKIAVFSRYNNPGVIVIYE